MVIGDNNIKNKILGNPFLLRARGRSINDFFEFIKYKTIPTKIYRPIIKNKIFVSIVSFWCGWRDLNPHEQAHVALNHARLPISPHPHIALKMTQTGRKRQGLRRRAPSPIIEHIGPKNSIL